MTKQLSFQVTIDLTGDVTRENHIEAIGADILLAIANAARAGELKPKKSVDVLTVHVYSGDINSTLSQDVEI